MSSNTLIFILFFINFVLLFMPKPLCHVSQIGSSQNRPKTNQASSASKFDNLESNSINRQNASMAALIKISTTDNLTRQQKQDAGRLSSCLNDSFQPSSELKKASIHVTGYIKWGYFVARQDARSDYSGTTWVTSNVVWRQKSPFYIPVFRR